MFIAVIGNQSINIFIVVLKIVSNINKMRLKNDKENLSFSASENNKNWFNVMPFRPCNIPMFYTDMMKIVTLSEIILSFKF